ncbi:hypothetical protein AADG42_10405 [Ammonicoccus fulvus]|uniref:RNA polymerase subunit sigma-70 n=1 Tax=Ammonicoccus fulvus TaxID=3138240 RepID=A0ABZ3FNR6_9ACTN
MESAELASAAADLSHPTEGLKAVASLRLLVETLEFRQVEGALRAGLSWTEVAELLGVTRQAVHKKYSKRIDPTINVPRRERR